VEATERFKEIAEAYQVLSDADKRNQYDQYGHDGPKQQYEERSGFTFASADEIFKQFFSGKGFYGFNVNFGFDDDDFFDFGQMPK